MAAGIPRGTTADSVGPGETGGAGRVPRPGPAGGWTAGRVVTLVIGAVLALVSLGLLGGGGTLLWAGGYVTTGTETNMKKRPRAEPQVRTGG